GAVHHRQRARVGDAAAAGGRDDVAGPAVGDGEAGEVDGDVHDAARGAVHREDAEVRRARGRAALHGDDVGARAEELDAAAEVGQGALQGDGAAEAGGEGDVAAAGHVGAGHSRAQCTEDAAVGGGGDHEVLHLEGADVHGAVHDPGEAALVG